MSEASNTRTCPRCGGRKDYYAICCRACKKPEEWARTNLGRRGPDHGAWKGGTMVDRDGYLKRYDPDHPFPRKGGYVREHVRVMELHIGRRILPTEVVHHRDGDITNNALSNLDLMDSRAHSRLHRSRDAHLRRRDRLGRFAGGGAHV